MKIGYVPLENAEDHVMEVEAHPDSEDEVGRLFQGAPFCSIEFDGSTDHVE